jgi:hypothetical protein
MTDDDRPPIVVTDGSVEIYGGYRWVDQSNNNTKKVWRPNHSKGKDAKKYEVEVTKDNGVSAGCSLRPGKIVEIIYGTGTTVRLTLTFDLKKNSSQTKDEPELTASPNPLTVKGSGFRLVYDGIAGDKITKVTVGQDSCDTSEMSNVEVVLTPKE